MDINALPGSWIELTGLIVIMAGGILTNQLFSSGRKQEKRADAEVSHTHIAIEQLAKQIAKQEKELKAMKSDLQTLRDDYQEAQEKIVAWRKRDHDWLRLHPESAATVLRPPAIKDDLPPL